MHCNFGALSNYSSLYSEDETFFSLSGSKYEGGSICNENPFITPATKALGCCAIFQTKDQSAAAIMVYETLFYLSEFNKLQTI